MAQGQPTLDLAVRYSVETTSDLRAWLKREGYGYVAQVAWNIHNLGGEWIVLTAAPGMAPPQLRPINAGVDMTPLELELAYRRAAAL